WRRLEIRNELARPGTAPIKHDDLERWARQFEAPDAAELALFDEAINSVGASTPLRREPFESTFASVYALGSAKSAATTSEALPFTSPHASEHSPMREKCWSRARSRILLSALESPSRSGANTSSEGFPAPGDSSPQSLDLYEGRNVL